MPLMCPSPGGVKAEATRTMGRFLRDVFRLNARGAELSDHGAG